MSHAHGWATGPAPALTHYLVGIQPFVAHKHHRQDGKRYFHYTVAPQILHSGIEFVNGSLAFDHAGTFDSPGNRSSVLVGWKNDSRHVSIVLDATALGPNYIGKLGIQFHGQSKIFLHKEATEEGDRDPDTRFERSRAKHIRLSKEKYRYGERVWFRNIQSGFRHVFQYDLGDS